MASCVVVTNYDLGDGLRNSWRKFQGILVGTPDENFEGTLGDGILRHSWRISQMNFWRNPGDFWRIPGNFARLLEELIGRIPGGKPRINFWSKSPKEFLEKIP